MRYVIYADLDADPVIEVDAAGLDEVLTALTAWVGRPLAFLPGDHPGGEKITIVCDGDRTTIKVFDLEF